MSPSEPSAARWPRAPAVMIPPEQAALRLTAGAFVMAATASRASSTALA